MTETEGTYEDDYTESTSTEPTSKDNTDATATYNETENESIEKTSEEEEQGEKLPPKPPSPPPEPEFDPLEGITYDDDPAEILPSFGEQSYWESVYTESVDIMEWYIDPVDVIPRVKDYFDEEGGRVLVTGTGTSGLAQKLVAKGAGSVVAIDFSQTVIKKMRKLNRETENLSFKVMDVRHLTFPEEEFNLIIDKATLDCVYHAGEKDVMEMLGEISKVLRRSGVFVCISNAKPGIYNQFFEGRSQDLCLKLENVIEIKKPVQSDTPYFMYVIKKVKRQLNYKNLML